MVASMLARRARASTSLLALAASLTVACEGTVTFSGDASVDRARPADAARDASAMDALATDAASPMDAASPTDAANARDGLADTTSVDAAPARVCPARGAMMDCSRGAGSGEGDQCRDGPSCFVTNVQRAVQNVINANPTWFDNATGCPRILMVPPFMDAVVADLRSQGVCAIRDPNAPEEEVTVKMDNSFSENFDIVASTGCARYGGAIYTGYCAPAWW